MRRARGHLLHRPPDVPPLKLKITYDDFSLKTSLDAAWQAKPFLTAIVKPIVLKLNKREHKEPVAIEYLEGDAYSRPGQGLLSRFRSWIQGYKGTNVNL